MNRLFRFTLALLLLLLVMFPAYSLQGTADNTIGTSQVTGTPLKSSLSYIYNMLKYDLPPESLQSITDAAMVGSKIISAGPGTYAILNVETSTRTVYLEHSGALVGNGIGAFVASNTQSNWLGTYTDAGEILLVNSTDYSYLLSYYTATRKPVLSASLYDSSNGTKLVALDNEGYAYFYNVPHPYMLEIGPTRHDTAQASLSGFQILKQTQLQAYDSGTTWSNANLTLLMLSSYEYTGSIKITLEYYNTTTRTYEPALAGTTSSGGYTVISTVYIYIVDNNGLAILSYESTSSTSNIYEVTDIPPGTRNILPVYVRTTIDPDTGDIVSQQCYSSGPFQETIYPLYTITASSKLDPIAPGLTDCLSIYGVTVLENVRFQPFLVVDLDKFNESSIYEAPDYQKALWISMLPLPSDIGTTAIDFIRAFKVSNPPAGWPDNATGIIMIGSGRYIFLYIVDENMTPQPLITMYKYFEILDVGEPVSSYTIYGDGSHIFVGNSHGTVYDFVWAQDYQRYLLANSYQLDTSGVTSLGVDSTGNYLVASSQGGILQLIDIANWKPLWRGIPGFTGIALDVGNPYLLGDPKTSLVIYSPSAGTLSVIYNTSLELVPFTVTVNIGIRDLNGTITPYNETAGYNATIYSGSDPVAYAEITEAGFLFYLPPGTYQLELNLSDLGTITKSYNIPYPGLDDTIKITLRQVDIYVYTPESIGNPEKNPGYYLMNGSKQGASLLVKQVSYDANLGYVPSVPSITTVTGLDGHALVVVWEGVSYSISGSLEGYTINTYLLSYYDNQRVNIIAHPDLTPVLFLIMDPDTVGTPNPYYIEDAKVSLFYYQTERSVVLSVDGAPTLYYLPQGSYNANITAPHYVGVALPFTVSGLSTQIFNTTLMPQMYLYQQKVFSSDPTSLGIANGPVGDAIINITMTWPVPGLIQQTLYTDANGELLTSLRYGIYKVEISYPYAAPVEFTLTLGADTSKSTTLTLNTSSVVFTIHDSEYTIYRVQNVTLSLTYIGSNYQNTVNITLPSGQTMIELPQGNYYVTVSAKYYETLKIPRTYSKDQVAELIYLPPKYVQLTVQALYGTAPGSLAEGPIQGAEVTVRINYPNIPIPPTKTYTDTQGNAILIVREGIYNISVRSPYTTSALLTQEVRGTLIVPVELQPLYGNLTVTITDSESRTLIPGVNLVILRTGPGITKQLEYKLDMGTIHLNLPAGDYRLIASYENRYYESETEVVLYGGQNATQTIYLNPIKVYVTIYTNSSQATITIGGEEYQLPETILSGTHLVLVPNDQLLQQVYNKTITATTGPDGKVTLQLRTGTYLLTAEKAGYMQLTVTTNITKDNDVYTIALTPYQTEVQLEVLDPGLLDPYLSEYNATIISYNNFPVNITFQANTKNLTLQMPTGLYSLLIEKELYYPNTTSFSIIATPTGDSHMLTVVLTPITTDVAITPTVESPVVTGEVTNATLILISETWNLADNYIKSEITGGSAFFTGVRPGQYQVYLSNNYFNIYIYLGEINITLETSQIVLNFTPPYNNVSFSIYDADIIGYQVNNTKITLVYKGPLGSGTIELPSVNGTNTTMLPNGEYELTIEALGYKRYTDTLIVRGNTTYTAILIPERVTLAIELVDIDDNPVTGAGITALFIHEGTGEITQGEVIDGKIVPYRGLRIGTYQVVVQPPEESYIDTTTATVRVTMSGALPDKIVATPKFYKLNITIYDPVKNGPVSQEVTITVTRSGTGGEKYGLPLITNVTNGTITLDLPYGLYTISVDTGPDSYFQNPKPVSLSLVTSQSIKITLIPKQYQITVYVIDDRGDPVPNAYVHVYKMGRLIASLQTDAQGSVTFSGTYGIYTVSVEASGYKSADSALNVPIQSSVTVSLMPGPKVIVKRYTPLIIGMIGIIILAAVFYFARNKIMSRLAEEEEYF